MNEDSATGSLISYLEFVQDQISVGGKVTNSLATLSTRLFACTSVASTVG